MVTTGQYDILMPRTMQHKKIITFDMSLLVKLYDLHNRKIKFSENMEEIQYLKGPKRLY